MKRERIVFSCLLPCLMSEIEDTKEAYNRARESNQPFLGLPTASDASFTNSFPYYGTFQLDLAGRLGEIPEDRKISILPFSPAEVMTYLSAGRSQDLETIAFPASEIHVLMAPSARNAAA